MNISRSKILIIAFVSLIIINIAIFALIRSRNNKQTPTPTAEIIIPGSVQEPFSSFPLEADFNADPQPDSSSQPTNIPPPTANTPPDQVVSRFLTFIQQDQRERAKTLISQQAKQQNFAPTLQGTQSPQSLYGKSFTFKVTNIFIEAPKTVSRITVQISQNNQITYRTLILLNTTGSWLLVDQEVNQIATSTEDKDQPPSP